MTRMRKLQMIILQKKKKRKDVCDLEAALTAVEVWPGGKALVCLSSKNVKVCSVNSLERRIRKKWRTEAEVRAACCQWKEENRRCVPRLNDATWPAPKEKEKKERKKKQYRGESELLRWR